MKWPNGARVAVCLTFDLDAEISWRNILRRHGIERDNPVVFSQGEYGPNVAVPRILKLLEKHGARAGFFVPGEVAEKYPEVVGIIHDAGHEIGNHGYSHKNPASCSLEEEREELLRGNRILEEITGRSPQGYRAPAADMSDNTLRLLTENGFLYDSTMMGSDLPYSINVGNDDIIELPIRWILDDWVYFGFNYFPPLEYQSGISSHRKVYEIWSDEFDAVHDEGLYFMLVMHPQIIGLPSRAKMLDDLIHQMKEKGDVWIATPFELSRFWKESVSQ
ncbi:MAG: polysaccharide deacetylase family protein [Candidatus Thorarchaeota archaeon]|jgi:peptidoglycan/xylan/chitin deacetylase (PgdA/CDA1 family)